MVAGYDALSRLLVLQHKAGVEELLGFSYAARDLNGLLTQVTESGSAASGVARRDYAYDPLSRLTRETRYNASLGVLKDVQWQLSGAGDWTQVQINPPPLTALTYDRTATTAGDPVTGNHRLRRVTAQTTADLAGTVSDGAGPLSVTVGGQPFGPSRQTGPSPDTWTVATADVQPGPNAVEATADGVTAQQTLNVDVAGVGDYEYDRNGNRVRYTDAFGAVTAYAYDRENRLTRIDYADGTASAFEYDGLGRRVATIEYNDLGGVTDEKRYLYDGVDLVEIRDGAEATLGQVIHGPGIDNPLAMVEFDPGTGTETARYFYHTDHLGSVRLLTDAGGGVARTYDYTAYGVRLDDPATETTLNPFTYTGREYHASSGLYFYRARFYDPAVGQFLSADPIGHHGGPNPYAYSGTNPATNLDPLGLDYVDANVTIPVVGPIGFSAGVLLSFDNSVHGYVGFALPAPGFQLTYSQNDVTLGRNAVGAIVDPSATIPPCVVIAGSISEPAHEMAVEAGIGTPGVGYIYVFSEEMTRAAIIASRLGNPIGALLTNPANPLTGPNGVLGPFIPPIVYGQSGWIPEVLQ